MKSDGAESVKGKIIGKAAQSRGKSSIKLHNIFLINVGPVIIVTMACRLTLVEGPVENQCLNVSMFYSQSIYTHRNGHASGRKARAGECFYVSMFYSESIYMYIHRHGDTSGRQRDLASSYCSIVSGDISNCSYRLSFISLTHLHRQAKSQKDSRNRLFS